jgi:hypothetical protein
MEIQKSLFVSMNCSGSKGLANLVNHKDISKQMIVWINLTRLVSFESVYHTAVALNNELNEFDYLIVSVAPVKMINHFM